MSNHLAVATVTAALQRLLQAPAAADVPGAKITTQRPDAVAGAVAAPTVNLYLYRVVPCAARLNDAMPSRRHDGSLVERPRAVIELEYLISCFGDDADLEPQRLLGSVVRTLTTRPVLGADLFDQVVTAAGAAPPVHPALIGSDLAEATEPVRLSPLPLDVEVLSKLWSVFLQTPHVLSVAWTASCVVLEESLVAQPSLPVVAPMVSVSPIRRPTISAVTVASDPGALLTAGVVARVTGLQLAGDATGVRVSGAELAAVSASAIAVDVDLAQAPPGALRAGPVVVEVVHRRRIGSPSTWRDDVVSRPFAAMLHPRITAVTVTAGRLVVTVDPDVGLRQQAVVQLLTPGTHAVEHVLPVAEHADIATVSVALAGVAAGAREVVLIVDGAASDPTPVVVP